MESGEEEDKPPIKKTNVKTLKWILIAMVVYGIFDVGFTTLSNFSYISRSGPFIPLLKVSIYRFDFARSWFDIWIIALLRSSLLIGSAIGCLWNHVDGPPRVKLFEPVVVALALMMWVYPMTKMLALSDVTLDFRLPWFWTLFAWSNIGPICLYLFWSSVGQYEIKSRGRTPLNEGTAEEREELLEEDETAGREKEQQEKKKSTTSIFRLLTYSKSDLGILLVAFFFLLISAMGE